MNFKKWYLSEVGTSTASIAVFSRPIFGGPVARLWPNSIVDDDDEDDKDEKKKDKKPKKKD